MMHINRWVALAGGIFLSNQALADAPTASEVAAVEKLHIFFGHQSVGENIIDGLKEVTGGGLRVVSSREPSAFDSPGLVETMVGENEAPLSKLSDFKAAMEAVGERPDVAFMKLCYIDFDESTDADALFEAYQRTMTELSAKYPRVTFVAVTAPLTTVESGLKARLKKLLGRALWGEAQNERRQRFNERVREAFRGKPLFDVARLEAQRSDGTTQGFERDGKTVPALAPEYTDDGGHLNVAGRTAVAGALVKMLAALPVKAAAPEAAPVGE